ncbi:MAG: CapA family protein [Nitrospirota bacterium]
MLVIHRFFNSHIKIFLLILSFGLFSCAPARKADLKPDKPTPSAEFTYSGEVSIAAVGDIIPHGYVKKSASIQNETAGDGSLNNNGYDFLFQKIKNHLNADIAIGNFESPIAPNSGNDGMPFVFNAPAAMAAATKGAGINVFNIANNHIYDQGYKGLLETVDHLKTLSIDHIGLYENDTPAPLIIEKNNIKAGIIGLTTLLNIFPEDAKDSLYVRKFDPDRDINIISEAKKRVDFLIVYLHWGNEYKKEPSAEQADYAARLAEAGADIIIGSHPHVLQPVSLVVKNDGAVVPVIYSLGNLISNQSRYYVWGVSNEDVGRTRDSAILRFKIKKVRQGDLSSTMISELYFIPLWGYNNTLLYEKKIDKMLTIYPSPIYEEMERIEKEIEQIKGIEEKAGLLKKLLTEYEMLRARLEIIKNTIGEDYIATGLVAAGE